MKYPEALELLRSLVRIDSCNTTFLDSDIPSRATEEEVCNFLWGRLAAHGFACEVQWARPRRPNFIAVQYRNSTLPWLGFEAHMDTVGVEGMAVPPFAAEVRDGKVYGRGAADTKGSIAAMIVALEHLLAENPPLNLVFVGTCAEESGCEGIARLDLGDLPLRAFIVGEPTSNRAVTAHKSHAWFEIKARGKAAHGSQPEAGDNAVYHMVESVRYLRDRVAPRLARDAAAGLERSTLSVNLIHGGRRVNQVPDECSASVDIRLVPGRKPEAVIEELTAELARNCPGAIQCSWSHSAPGLLPKPGSPVLAALQAAIEAHGGNPAPLAVNYCTDAGVLAQRGADAVVFGPGNILQAHSSDEFLEIEQLDRAVDILIETAHRFAAGQ